MGYKGTVDRCSGTSLKINSVYRRRGKNTDLPTKQRVKACSVAAFAINKWQDGNAEQDKMSATTLN